MRKAAMDAAKRDAKKLFPGIAKTGRVNCLVDRINEHTEDSFKALGFDANEDISGDVFVDWSDGRSATFTAGKS